MLQKPKDSATADAAGHIDLSDDANWITVGKQWAKIITRDGAERWRFKQVEAEVNRIVEMPCNSITSAMTPRWRLKHQEGSRTITSDVAYAVNKDSGDITIQVGCKEVME